MLSWIFLILVIALICVLGFLLSARVFGRGEDLPPLPASAEVIELNRRAVAAGDLDAVTLEVVHRGYRMDQVDDLIAQLAGGAASPDTVGRASQSPAPGPDPDPENGVDFDETDRSRA